MGQMVDINASDKFSLNFEKSFPFISFNDNDNNFLTDLEGEHFLIKAKPMYPAIQGIIKNFNTKSYVHFLNQSSEDCNV